jgi:hypothetical protein
MEMDYVSKEEREECGNSSTYPVYFLRVSEKEAIAIIKSLANQLVANHANTGREEFWTKNGEYFSIGVEFDER